MSHSLLAFLAFLAFLATSATFPSFISKDHVEDAVVTLAYIPHVRTEKNQASKPARINPLLHNSSETPSSFQDDDTIEKSFDASKQRKTIIGATFIVVVIVGLALVPKVFIYLAWKRVRQKQEIKNIEEISVRSEPKPDIYFNELRDLAMRNDPTFLKQFMDAYPDLTSHLLEKHPKLSKSELSLCAMIYLDFSSKEIAEYTFIQHRSVQTNRSRLRKKMQLAPEVDLFHYITSFA